MEMRVPGGNGGLFGKERAASENQERAVILLSSW